MDTPSRRWLVDFDPEHFGKRAETGTRLEPVQVFRESFQSNHWGGASRSGPGSTPHQVAAIAAAIPGLCERLEVRRLLDLPCGDFTWMASVELPGVSYVGGDLVPEIVAQNRQRYGADGRSFFELDVTSSELPAADLMLCRDCLVHLSNNDVLAALRNVARSGIRWLLSTTFPDEAENVDVLTGDWRPIDLMKPPFNLPEPVEFLSERCTEQDGAFADKALGLWPVSSLPGGQEP